MKDLNIDENGFIELSGSPLLKEISGGTSSGFGSASLNDEMIAELGIKEVGKGIIDPELNNNCNDGCNSCTNGSCDDGFDDFGAIDDLVMPGFDFNQKF